MAYNEDLSPEEWPSEELAAFHPQWQLISRLCIVLPLRRETLTLTTSRLIHTTRSLLCSEQLSVQEVRLANVEAVNLLSIDPMPSSITANAGAVLYVLQFATVYACVLSPLLLLSLVDIRFVIIAGVLLLAVVMLLVWRRLQLRTLAIITASGTRSIDLEQADAEEAHNYLHQVLHPTLQHFALPLPSGHSRFLRNFWPPQPLSDAAEP